MLTLFKTERFLPLFVTQFLGAFNDNLFKNSFAIVVTFHTVAWTTLPTEIIATLIGAIFILPYFLFSGLCGELADVYDKAYLSRFVKILEIILMSIALLGFYIHSFEVLLFVVFGLGVHSTLFGPIKYAILPQHLKSEELLGANALVESGTFVAILLGTICGGFLAIMPNGGLFAANFGILLAICGLWFSRQIPSAPSLNDKMQFSFNIISQNRRVLALAYKNREVFWAIVAISWFWLYGSLFLAQFPAFVKLTLGGNELIVTLFLTLFTLGIALGSVVCEKLSGQNVKIWVIGVGAVGISLCGVHFGYISLEYAQDLGLWSNRTFWLILLDLLFIGFFGGLFSVPCYTLMQTKSDAKTRSSIIAANNILNALFMVLGSVFAMFFLSLKFSIAMLFVLISILGLVATLWFVYKLKKDNK